MKKTIFEYEGHPITFEDMDTTQMINATEMIKAFPSKKMNNFIRNTQTKNFIEVLESKTRIRVLVVNHGGNNVGTWMHETLALKFAAWLSPDFELWVYERIKELLKTGKTELDRSPNVFKALRQMIDQLEHQELINKKFEEQHEITSERLDEVEARLIVQDKNFLSVAAYCSLNGIDCPLDKAQKWGIKATTLSKKLNKHFYHIHDPRFGRVGVYHTEILQQIIG